MALVLIVDDQPAIRTLLISWIIGEGYQTAQATNAKTAFDEIVVRPVETAIILTAADTNVPPVTRLQPGVVGYLVMPFGREAVLEALRIGVQWYEWLASPPRTEHPGDR
jgi:DNA-binding response OmpR family regulator